MLQQTNIPRSTTRLRRAAAVGAATTAALAAWLIIEVGFGVDLRAPGQGGPGFDVEPIEVLLTAVLAGLGGWATLALLERWTRRAGRLWPWVATAAFLISLGGPMSGTGIPGGHRWLLALLHVVVATVLIPLLGRTARGEPSARMDRSG